MIFSEKNSNKCGTVKETKRTRKQSQHSALLKKSTTVHQEAAVVVETLNCFCKANHSYDAVH